MKRAPFRAEGANEWGSADMYGPRSSNGVSWVLLEPKVKRDDDSMPLRIAEEDGRRGSAPSAQDRATTQRFMNHTG